MLYIYTLSAFNYNSAPVSNVVFQTPIAYNNTGGDISFNGTDTFTFNVSGVYMIDYNPQVIASASYVSIFMNVNSTTRNVFQMNQSATSCRGLWVGNISATQPQTLVFVSNRVGLNASAKNNILSLLCGPLLITRLA